MKAIIGTPQSAALIRRAQERWEDEPEPARGPLSEEEVEEKLEKEREDGNLR